MGDMGQSFHCATCGEDNQAFIDPDDGDFQELIHDCCVCQQKNKIHALFSFHDTNYDLEVYPEITG